MEFILFSCVISLLIIIACLLKKIEHITTMLVKGDLYSFINEDGRPELYLQVENYDFIQKNQAYVTFRVKQK